MKEPGDSSSFTLVPDVIHHRHKSTKKLGMAAHTWSLSTQEAVTGEL